MALESLSSEATEMLPKRRFGTPPSHRSGVSYLLNADRANRITELSWVVATLFPAG